MTDKEKLKYLMSLQIIKLEGWAGVLPNGNIVDRREHPTAIPMQKNTLLGIPEPRPLPTGGGKVLHVLRHDEPSWWGGEPPCVTCTQCRHCGPPVGSHPTSGTPLIRCNHPSWGDEETEMREIDPDFAEMCEDFDSQNTPDKPAEGSA